MHDNEGMLTLKDAKGIGDFVKGPTLCFNKAFGPNDIQTALEHLEAFIANEGPFDGIMGFSQGGSLALTYLLQEAMTMVSGTDSSSSSDEREPTVPAFKFAVLLSTIVAFSPDPTFCSGLLSGLNSNDRSILHNFPHATEELEYGSLSGPPERAVFFKSLGLVLDKSLSGGFIAPNTDLGLTSLRNASQEPAAGADLELVPRLMHPAFVPPDVRVRIPTVHVVGHKDDAVLIDMSHLMERVCEPQLVRRLAHDGGHDVPRTAKDVRALWSAVEWAMRESMCQLW